MVNNFTNINKHHLSLQLIEWWSTIPLPISTKITPLFNSLSDGQQWYRWNCWPSINELSWEVIFVDIDGIVDHHSMSLCERCFLFLAHWVMVNIPPISTKITSHLNSLSDGQQFHQYQQKSPLTSTHWMMVGDACWYRWNCWPSINELRWEVIFVDIDGIVDHHSMSLCERCFLLILVTSTHWVMVNNSTTNINKNHPSVQLIEWWSTIPPIWTKIISHLNSSSLNELKWEVIFVDICGIVDHHSMSWSERWFLLIFVELLTITQWVEVRGDLLIEWWSTIPPISIKITSHLNSLSDGQQFHQYQQQSPLTSTLLRWEVIFVDIGGIVDHHSMS
jgi:hypothetical protein